MQYQITGAICTIFLISIGAIIIRDQLKQQKEFDREINSHLERLNGAKIGTSIRMNKGFNYGKIGIIVDYGFMQSVCILFSDGSREEYVALKDISLVF